jgi:hypothetical protein
MICLQSDIGMFLYWLQEGLHASTRKIARLMKIDLAELRALRDGVRKPTLAELDRMAAFARRIVAEGKIREPHSPYLWNWSIVSPFEDTAPVRPLVTTLKDFYR